jgi:hypothetical protein
MVSGAASSTTAIVEPRSDPARNVQTRAAIAPSSTAERQRGHPDRESSARIDSSPKNAIRPAHAAANEHRSAPPAKLRIIWAERQMIGEFRFEHDGRTYTCSVEQPRGSRTEAWWWFAVSGDQQRYAPFQAAANDTQDSVRSRIITYYGDLLFRRAQPAVPRHHWARRGNNAATPAAAAPAAPEAAPLKE